MELVDGDVAIVDLVEAPARSQEDAHVTDTPSPADRRARKAGA
ncbi:hypothetical protein AB0L74_24510 [Streptomyces sp. NPDC052020]